MLCLCCGVVLAGQLTAMSPEAVEFDACCKMSEQAEYDHAQVGEQTPGPLFSMDACGTPFVKPAIDSCSVISDAGCIKGKSHLDCVIENLARSMCSYGAWIECPYFVFSKEGYDETAGCSFRHKPMPPQLTCEEYMQCCSMLTSKAKPTKPPTVVFHNFDQFIEANIGFGLVIKLGDKIRSFGGRCHWVFFVNQARKYCPHKVKEQLDNIKLHLIARRQSSEVVYGCNPDAAQALMRYEFEESKAHWRWWQFHIAQAEHGVETWFDECACK